MPASRRHRETATPSPSPPPPPHEEEGPDESPHGSDNHSHERPEDAGDLDGSSDTSGEENDGFITVKLGEIRKEVQCPICLGIIRKTRTVMECLHRFCRECIDKSMRLGNNECPACRTHCASRRSLRDDPNYDALIAALYPDIDKYEEEELSFLEEEKARNKQIQASIAQTLRRQTEAAGKKKPPGRAARRQSNNRNSRGRRNHRVVEHYGSDEEDEANEHDASKDSSSADEHSAEVKSKRYKRWSGGRTSQPSSGINAEGIYDDNDAEANREVLGASATLLGSKEFITWGRGGVRSSNRHGGLSWAHDRLTRNNRLSKLINRLQCAQENVELKISLMLVSLQEENIPSLKRPYISCSPTMSIKQLCQYVSMQTSVEATEIEMLIIKDIPTVNNSKILGNENESGSLNLCHYESELLIEHQTLEEIHTRFYQENLILGYRKQAQVKVKVNETDDNEVAIIPCPFDAGRKLPPPFDAI